MSRKAALIQMREGGGKVCSFFDVLLKFRSGCFMGFLSDKATVFCLKEFFRRSEAYEDRCLR